MSDPHKLDQYFVDSSGEMTTDSALTAGMVTRWIGMDFGAEPVQAVPFIISPGVARYAASIGGQLPDNILIQDRLPGFHCTGLSIEKWWFDEDLSRIERRQINPRTMWRDQPMLPPFEFARRWMPREQLDELNRAPIFWPPLPDVKPCTRAVRNTWGKP